MNLFFFLDLNGLFRLPDLPFGWSGRIIFFIFKFVNFIISTSLPIFLHNIFIQCLLENFYSRPPWVGRVVFANSIFLPPPFALLRLCLFETVIFIDHPLNQALILVAHNLLLPCSSYYLVQNILDNFSNFGDFI